MSPATFTCGHPRTEANSAGKPHPQCRFCKRMKAAVVRVQRDQERLNAGLAVGAYRSFAHV